MRPFRSGGGIPRPGAARDTGSCGRSGHERFSFLSFAADHGSGPWCAGHVWGRPASAGVRTPAARGLRCAVRSAEFCGRAAVEDDRRPSAGCGITVPGAFVGFHASAGRTTHHTSRYIWSRPDPVRFRGLSGFCQSPVRVGPDRPRRALTEVDPRSTRARWRRPRGQPSQITDITVRGFGLHRKRCHEVTPVAESLRPPAAPPADRPIPPPSRAGERFPTPHSGGPPRRARGRRPRVRN